MVVVGTPASDPFVTEWTLGKAELTLWGELDIATVDAFETSVAERTVDGQDLVVDLTDLSFVDSTGLAALMRVHRRLRDGGGDLVLTHAAANVRQMLSVSGLDQVITLLE